MKSNESGDVVEVWEDIKGYKGLYQVSNLGNIKSLIRDKEKVKYMGNSGYLRVGLFKNSKRKNYSVHRIIAETFIKNPLNKKVVNHIDGNKLNNSIGSIVQMITEISNAASEGANGSTSIAEKSIDISNSVNELVLQANLTKESSDRLLQEIQEFKI